MTTLGLKPSFSIGALVAAVLAAVSCSTHDPSTLDPGVQSNPHGATSCATPNAGCPCDTPGKQVDCGEVIRQSGNYVTCSVGTRTCSGGRWGACIGDTIATRSLNSVTLTTTQDLQIIPTPCTDDPCDPGCMSYTDDGAGLDAGLGFIASDAGLTLGTGDGSACTNLQCFQVSCSGDGGPTTTTLTGRVVAGTQAPFGAPDPVPNVLVYVPNTAVQPFTPGVQCSASCSADVTGTPIAATLTAPDGTFTLTNVPAPPNNAPVPVVIQLGRWRRQVSFPIVQCATNAAGDIHMPRNQSEGDIPLTAIDTGATDALECVLWKMGVSQTEFTDPGGTGRIHVYRYNGSQIDPSTPPEAALVNSKTKLNRYDQILFPCEGGQYSKDSNQPNLINYTSSGGRVFATHYSYTWLYDVLPFSSTANWQPNAQTTLTSTTAQIDTSLSKAQTLATWLGVVGGLSSTSPPQMTITNARQDIASTGVNPPSARWMYNVGDATGAWPLHYTFDTPFNQSPSCGRVVFTDFHVTYPSSSGTTFPNECPQTPMTSQEKALEFLLFDLASCSTALPALAQSYPLSYTYTVDYQGICPAGQGPVWRFFDWQTITPSDSSIFFNAGTAPDEPSLATASFVYLGTASGAPITTWTGTDVGAALAPTPSLAWVRVNITLNPSSDHNFAPTLTAWRQLYDCVANQ